jgi:hypothetical protein
MEGSMQASYSFRDGVAVKAGTVDETALKGRAPGWYVVAGPEARGPIQFSVIARKRAQAHSLETPHHAVHVAQVA